MTGEAKGFLIEAARRAALGPSRPDGSEAACPGPGGSETYDRRACEPAEPNPRSSDPSGANRRPSDPSDPDTAASDQAASDQSGANRRASDPSEPDTAPSDPSYAERRACYPSDPDTADTADADSPGPEGPVTDPAIFRKQSEAKEIWRRFRKNRNAMIGLSLFLLIFLACFVTPLFIPYTSVTKQNIRQRFAPPTIQHPAGTDHFGRDELARLLYGGRTTMAIGITAAALSLLVGGSLGMLAAYYDKLDNPVMRLIDVLASIPPILMALAIVSALGANLQNVILAIAIARMPAFCRVIRAAVLSVADQEFIEAARAGGTSDLRVLYKHVLPNCLGTIIVQTTMNMSLLMLAAASLSFIGMGVQPPAPEWGAMLSEAREYMLQATSLMVLPGVGIVLVTTQLNLIGDGLRDAFDPKLRN